MLYITKLPNPLFSCRYTIQNCKKITIISGFLSGYSKISIRIFKNPNPDIQKSQSGHSKIIIQISKYHNPDPEGQKIIIQIRVQRPKKSQSTIWIRIQNTAVQTNTVLVINRYAPMINISMTNCIYNFFYDLLRDQFKLYNH